MTNLLEINTTNVEALFGEHFTMKEDNKKLNHIQGNQVQIIGGNSEATMQQNVIVKHFQEMRRRYSTSLEYYTTQDMVQEYSTLFIEGCYLLNELEPIEFYKENPKEYSSVIKFIKDRIQEGFGMRLNGETNAIVTRNGVKYIDFNVTSLNQTMSKDGENGQIGDFVSDENSIYGHGDYHKNHFISWVLEKKSEIMTARQLEVFDYLMDNYIALTDRTPEKMAMRNEMLENIGLNSNSLNRYFTSIKEKCTKKYEKEFGNVYYSHVTAGRVSLHEMLNEYVKSADCKKRETAEERQIELNSIIQKYYNNEEQFELIITEGLSLDEKRELVRCVRGTELASNTVLRKVRANIVKYQEENELVIEEAKFTKFNYNEDLMSALRTIESAQSFKIIPGGMAQYVDEEGKKHVV